MELRSDKLLSQVRGDTYKFENTSDPDLRRFILDAQKLCDEFVILRSMALKLDSQLHKLVKEREHGKVRAWSRDRIGRW